MANFAKRLQLLAKRVARRFNRNPVGPGGANAAWYDRLFASSRSGRCHYRESHYYFLWAVIADRVRRARCWRVLEIGCGPGQLASFLLDQGIKQYSGLDFSPAAIALARKAAPQGCFVLGDARSPEIHRKVEHDAVVCTEVLEHIHEDLAVISNFLPGKRCFCSVPNFPYDSHVRYFKNADEVAARYGRFFTDLDVATFKSPKSETDEFFLFEGVRNTVVHDART
jgi:2-polyprenyl-3-methyl-5-hydroxy-6-metoxy-1,4-benzoquinol methylase